MSEGNAIDAATRRLSGALDALDAALDRRIEADKVAAGRLAEVQAMGADRARLASDLDQAVARNRTLEVGNREIARRLDNAIDSIRRVLDNAGG